MCTDISIKRIYRWQLTCEKVFKSLATKELQIKTTIKYPYAPIKMTKIFKNNHNSKGYKETGKEMEKLDHTHIAGLKLQ